MREVADYVPRGFDATTQALRVPPHSQEAEQSVLGGLMLDNAAWDQVVDLLTEDDFYRRDHRLIFRAVASLADKAGPFDVVTLSEWLEARGELSSSGGLAYLATLARDTPSAANIRAYANIVRERSVLRALIHVGTDIAGAAYNPEGRDASELIDFAEQRVFEIADHGARTRQDFQGIHDLAIKAIERIDFLYHQKCSITGIPAGFSDFDEMTSGLQPSDFVIVAGRPSMGKTSFAMNIAEHASIKEKKVVAIFSMEMPGEQLAMRMISSLGRVDQHRVRTGKLDDDDWPRLTSAVSILSGANMLIDDTPALSLGELRARCRRLKREKGLDLIIIDYLQLMQVLGSKENRTAEISEISRGLKSLAKELRVPVIALSQLNRSLEQRPNKRPQMSDLRECVTGDTLVILASGQHLAIGDLVGQTPQVLAVNGKGNLITASAEKIWCVGKKPVFNLHLASGQKISATEKHRLYSRCGWQQLQYLSVNDKIAIVKSIHQDTLPDTHSFSKNTISWERIIAIEPEVEADVYDLTVPGPASWLANGIVSHNSGAIEQDADLIVFIYRDEVYNEDSTDKGTAEIIIGKQRNGPIGTIRLTFFSNYTRFENFMPNAYSSVPK
ncbi:Replicative DNA helicase [Gammaproteobacteria bacterium]